MSDMRDFGNSSEPVLGTNFRPIEREDFSSQRIDLTGEGVENAGLRPLDESSGLGDFHQVDEDEPGSNTGKIVGALAVALIIGGAGAFGYMSSLNSSTSKPAIIASTPAPKVAAATPAPAPVTQENTTDNSAAALPAGAPASTDTPVKSATAKTVPVRMAKASIRKERTETASVPDMTPTPTPAPAPAPEQSTAPQPSQQAAVVPEPVSPAAPQSSIAANNPAVTTPANPAVAPDMPSPQPAPQSAPQDVQAQNQAVTPVQPAPADQAQPAPAPQPELAAPAQQQAAPEAQPPVQ